jgi:arylsulfatase
MQELFMKEAVKYSVLPIDDRVFERINAALVGRPDLMAGRTTLTVFEGMTGMSENVFINTKNRSHTITAEVQIPKGGAKGVILAQGGRFGGWSLYMKNGKPTYTYNFLGLKRFTIAATKPVPAGKATIGFEFAYDGGGLGKGGTGRLFVNGKQVAQGRIDPTQPMIFSPDEGADVGADGETPVVENYGIPAPYKFTGKINKITIDLKEMKTADKEKAQMAQKEASLKKALSD